MTSARKSALAVLAALALTLVCAPPPARAAEPDKFVGPDTEMVAFINVRQILDSELVKKNAKEAIEKGIKENKELQQLLSALGLDPLKDINSVLITAAGAAPEKVLVVVRGKFDQDKLQKVAAAVAKEKPDELKISTEGKLKIFEGKGKDGHTVYSTILDNQTLLAAPDKKALVAAAKLDGKGKPNKDLADALAKLDAKQSIYVAGILSKDVKKMISGANPMAAPFADKLTGISGNINVASGLDVALNLHVNDPMIAKALAGLEGNIKGGLDSLKAINQDLAPLADELGKTLKFTAEKDRLEISFKISGEVIDKMAKSIPKP